MIYQWKIPNKYSISAQEAGAEIEGCKNADGYITPEAVVEKASAVTSVIHGCFEWNDQNAAERYRLNQAKELLRNIVTVDVDTASEEPTIVRAFINIKGDSERGYKLIDSVMQSPNEHAYMLECAKNELRAFTHKYSILQELSGVMAAIREVTENHED